MATIEKLIPFSPPDISEEEINEVAEALRSGWITTGPRTKRLEKLIANYVGTEMCVCLNSQTACAEMALRVLGVTPNDEIITSAYTYTASASIIDHIGAKIILIDTQKDSFEMDYDALEAAITEKTKAIIPVDLGGVVCNYDRLFEIVERKKNLFRANSDIQKALGRVAIMADTAHSFGASRNGKMTGSIADFSSFSFHAVKIITGSSGGMLLTDSKEAADKVRKWSTQSRERAAWYQHEEIGYNYRMSNGDCWCCPQSDSPFGGSYCPEKGNLYALQGRLEGTSGTDESL